MDQTWMDLKKEYPELQGGRLKGFYLEKLYDGEDQNERWHRPAVVVLPGGGYSMVSKREGEAIAAAFLAQGFQSFVLDYEIPANGALFPEPMKEGAAAIDFLKKHAKDYHLNPKEIFLVGFSAGGHLAGCLAYGGEEKAAWDEGFDSSVAGVGLCYPVVNEESHPDSFRNLLGKDCPKEKYEQLCSRLSLLAEVNEKSVPTFLWATATDDIVPCQHLLHLAEKLISLQVPTAVRIYPQGVHGLSLATEEIAGKSMNWNARPVQDVKAWLGDCAAFFRRYCEEED